MIPVQNSLDELEKCHEVRDIALDCYLTAIRNVAHYAIELDDEITAPHRKYLTALAGEVASARKEALVDSRATLRGLLRDYRDKAAQYLNRLREELASTARALQETLDSLVQVDSDNEVQLRAALGRLREVSELPEASAMRAVVLAAVNTIEQTLEEIRKQHQLSVSQFLVEIRMLHQRIDALETAAMIDNLTKLLKRGQMEERIRSVSGEKVSLLLVKVSGFRLVEWHFDREVAAELAGAFIRRLRNSLPADTVIGRWSEEEFIAMLSPERLGAISSAKQVAGHLSGDYVCLQGGNTVRPSLQVSVMVVDCESGDTPERTLERVGEFLTGV
jgi:GGDEF domain-containing protein